MMGVNLIDILDHSSDDRYYTGEMTRDDICWVTFWRGRAMLHSINRDISLAHLLIET